MNMLMQSNPDIQDWMRVNSLGSLSQLETYFESRVLDLATLAGRSYIVWQVRSNWTMPELETRLDHASTGLGLLQSDAWCSPGAVSRDEVLLHR